MATGPSDQDFDAIIQAARDKARVAAWGMIGLAGAAALVLLLETALVVLVIVAFGVMFWLDPSIGPPNSGNGPSPAAMGGMVAGIAGGFLAIQLLNLVPAAVIAYGGFNLLKLRSARWAMAGGVTCLVFAFTFLFMQVCMSWPGMLMGLLMMPLSITVGVLALVNVTDKVIERGFVAQAELDGR